MRSLASSAFSLPICAYYFKLMSVSGFVTNALCLWLVSGIFSAGLVTAIAALRVEPNRNRTWVAPCVAGRGWCSELVRGMASLPYSAVSLENPYAAVWTVFFFFAVWLICLRSKKLAARSFCSRFGRDVCRLLGLPRWTTGTRAILRLRRLEVGQGQCLIYTADGETSVVDCGGAAG